MIVTPSLTRRGLLTFMTMGAAGLVVGCGRGAPSVSTPREGWQALPDWPLSARSGPATAWTGTEALFVGGDRALPCPAAAGCAAPSEFVGDGAALDPTSGSWRVIRPAPRPVPAYTSAARLGSSVYVLSERDLLAYRPDRDEWSVEPLPDDVLGWGSSTLAADESRLVVVRGERARDAGPDVTFDPDGGTWAPLPDDPMIPAFDRSVTATSAGLVLTGHDLVPQPGSEKPSFTRAALLPPGSAQWVLLPDSDQIGAGPWAWTGRRLVSPQLGGADGGEINGYGRVIPFGGILDPVTATWSRLPSPPADDSGGWPVSALGGPVTAFEGWLYDDRDRSWTLLDRPDGAPSLPGQAVWADGSLVVLGGEDQGGSLTTETRSVGAWLLTSSAS